MQESDLHTAIMRSKFELESKGIDFGSTSSMAFHMGNTMTSCPAVMALPNSPGRTHGARSGEAFPSWLRGWLSLI
jgi:K+-transporting ATPase A subunit